MLQGLGLGRAHTAINQPGPTCPNRMLLCCALRLLARLTPAGLPSRGGPASWLAKLCVPPRQSSSSFIVRRLCAACWGMVLLCSLTWPRERPSFLCRGAACPNGSWHCANRQAGASYHKPTGIRPLAPLLYLPRSFWNNNVHVVHVYESTIRLADAPASLCNPLLYVPPAAPAEPEPK